MWEIIETELLSSIFLFILFLPIQNNYFGWLQHFFSILLHDKISYGGIANPSILYGLWILKKISSIECVLRLFVNLIVSFIGHHIVHFLVPTIPLNGPKLHTTIINGILCEFLCGFALMMLVIYVSSPRTGLSSKIPSSVIAALGIRIILLLEGGKFTGASMNPLWAIAWEFYRDTSDIKLPIHDQILYSLEFISVYIIAPTVGASFAVFLYKQFYQKNNSNYDKKLNKKLD